MAINRHCKEEHFHTTECTVIDDHLFMATNMTARMVTFNAQGEDHVHEMIEVEIVGDEILQDEQRGMSQIATRGSKYVIHVDPLEWAVFSLKVSRMLVHDATKEN